MKPLLGPLHSSELGTDSLTKSKGGNQPNRLCKVSKNPTSELPAAVQQLSKKLRVLSRLGMGTVNAGEFTSDSLFALSGISEEDSD